MKRVIAFSKSMRKTTPAGIEENGDIMRFPTLMISHDEFQKWYEESIEAMELSSTRLSTQLTRELSLIQDYLVNLRKYIDRANDQQLQLIGCLIYIDFINFSGRIEKLAVEFFEKDLLKLRLSN